MRLLSEIGSQSIPVGIIEPQGKSRKREVKGE